MDILAHHNSRITMQREAFVSAALIDVLGESSIYC